MADGRDYFRASIDHSQFDRDAAHISGTFSDIGRNAESEGSRIDSTFKKIAATIAGAFTIQKASQFVKDVANIRGEFQQLEIAFETMLGSKAKSDALMSQLVNTAAKTPFDLTGIANGAKQLLAYGTASETVNDTLIRLGNIASGLSIPLNDLVYLYGTTQVQGRLFTNDLNQFMGRGIPLVKELSKSLNVSEQDVKDLVSAGKVGFPELQKVFENLTNEGGMFFNLMEKQSASITGQIANLEDAWDMMLNEIGTKSEDTFTTSIDIATALVENYQTVGEVIAVLVATYGTYKAAVIALNIAQSMQAKIALESALAGRTLTTAQGIQAVFTKQLTSAQAALNKTMLANPYVLATMALVGLGYAMYKVITHQTDAEKAQTRLNDAIKEAEKASISESKELARLKGELSAATKGTDEYNEIKEKIVKNYGKYYDGLDQEIEKVGLLESTYDKLTKAIQKSFGARQYESFIKSEQESLDSTMSDYLGKIQDKLIDKLGEEAGSKYYSRIRKAIMEGSVSIEQYNGAALKTVGLDKETQDALNKVSGKSSNSWVKDYSIESYISKIREAQFLTDELDRKAKVKFGIENLSPENKESDSDIKKVRSLTEQTEDARKAVTQLKKELSDLRTGKTPSDNYAESIEDKAKKLKSAEDRLSFLLTGKSSSNSVKSTSDADKKKKEAQDKANLEQRIRNNEAKNALDAQSVELDNQQKMLDIQQDGFDKEQRQIDLNHKKELLNIQKKAQELIEARQQVEKDQWEKEGSKGVFIAKTQTVEDLPNDMRAQLIMSDVIALKTTEKATDDLHKTLLGKYKNFSARRLEIEEQYNNGLKALNELPESKEKTDAVKQLEKQKKESIKSINEEESAELVKTTDLFVRLFTDASKQSVNQIKSVINETQSLYDYLSTTPDKDITDNFGFTAQQLRNFKGNAEQLKAILDGLNAKKRELGNISPFEAFSQGLEGAITSIQKGGTENISKGIREISTSIESFLPSVNKFGDDLSAIFGEGVGDDISTITTLLGGTAEMGLGVSKIMAGDVVGGLQSAISGFSAVFSMASNANKVHREALKNIENERLDFQQKYNMLLKEESLLKKDSESIFGEKKIEKAANAIKEYNLALLDLKDALKGDKPVERSGIFGIFDQADYKKQLDLYNQGLGGLANTQIVTGHKKTGLFGWGKGKDTYSSILDIPEYKDILKDGKLDIDMTQTILDTRKVSDETRKYLENLIELQKFADKAQEELRSYLQETFGSLGTGAIDSIIESIKSGTDAWIEFGKVGASVLENLGEQIAYELFFADKFKKLQADLESIYGSGADSDQIAKDSMDLVGQFYQSIGSNMEMAQDWMTSWKEEAKKQGFDLWGSGDFSQSSSKGGFSTATQDQIEELNGRFTSVQFNTANSDAKLESILTIAIERNDILKSYTLNFQELRDIGLQSMYHLQDLVKYTKVLPDMASDIAKVKENTKKI